MDVGEITLDQEQVKKQVDQWKGGLTTEEQLIARAYRAIQRGRKLLDLSKAMRIAGCDDKGRPQLAIARADAKRVEMSQWNREYVEFESQIGRWNHTTKESSVRVSARDLPGHRQAQVRLTAAVPIIPTKYRPGKTQLRRFWILFDADWTEVAKDPFLLMPLGGTLYVIMAAWDLTPVERAVLRGRER
jgi:hypothetical protein